MSFVPISTKSRIARKEIAALTTTKKRKKTGGRKKKEKKPQAEEVEAQGR